MDDSDETVVESENRAMGSLTTSPPFGSASDDVTTNKTFYETQQYEIVARATFLVVFLVCGFVGNCVLLAVVAQNKPWPGSKLSVYIISLALANVIDSLVSVSLTLGPSINEDWEYSSYVCRVHVFTMHIISVCVVYGLLMLFIDRLVMLLEPPEYASRLTKTRVYVLVILQWVVAIVSCVVLLTPVVDVSPSYPRYICTIQPQSSTSAAVSYVMLVVFVIPLLLIVACIVLLVKLVLSELAKVKSLQQTGKQYAQDAQQKQEALSPVLQEFAGVKFVLFLFAFWCVLHGPQHLVLTVENFHGNDVWPGTGNAMQVTLTWLRLGHSIVLPVFVFCWRKQIWRRVKNRVMCKKSNHIKDASPRAEGQPRRKRTFRNIIGMKKRKSSRNVPVLYANSGGVFLQALDTSTSGVSTGMQDTTVVTSRNCDVLGSVPDFNATSDDIHGGDTSDYDSQYEVDPFSNSNPIAFSSDSHQHTNGTAVQLRNGGPRSRQNSENRNSETASTLVSNDSVNSTLNRKPRVDNTHAEEAGSVRSSSDKTSTTSRPRNDSCRGSSDGSIVDVHARKIRVRTPKTDDTETPAAAAENGTASGANGLDVPTVDSTATPKRKKRKKKKIGQIIDKDVSEEPLALDNPAVTTVDEEGKVVEQKRRPPPRLKPIEPKRPLPADPEIPTASPPLRSDLRPQKEHLQIDKHKRNSTESATSSRSRTKGTRAKRCSGATNTADQTAPTSTATGTAHRSTSHRHSNASDSEAPLINSSSATSTDLSDISQRNNHLAMAHQITEGSTDSSMSRRARRAKRRIEKEAEGETTHKSRVGN